tara:strand:+ start:12680 stop:13441 length:762 start_codon:yes stop_codon:yes gene_type:complete
MLNNEPNFTISSEFFQIKEEYDNKNKILMKAAKKNNRKFVPKCIFCNGDGGNDFIRTDDRYIIKCKTNKCSEKLEYNRKGKINIDNKIAMLKDYMSNLKDKIRKFNILLKLKLDDNVNDEELLLMNKHLSDVETELNKEIAIKNNLEKMNDEKINGLLLNKENLLKDLKEYNNTEVLNFKMIVDTNEEIKNVEEDVFNLKYEVQNITEYRDTLNAKTVDEISEKYSCKDVETLNLNIDRFCTDTLETELSDLF